MRDLVRDWVRDWVRDQVRDWVRVSHNMDSFFSREATLESALSVHSSVHMIFQNHAPYAPNFDSMLHE